MALFRHRRRLPARVAPLRAAPLFAAPLCAAPLRAALALGAAGLVAAGLAAAPARASDPLPNDSVAPPPNVNLLMIYNEFSSTGAFAPVRGGDEGHTRVVNDVTVLRYVRTFEVDGVEGGVQAYLPYVGFLGAQKIGGGGVSAHSGFAQPNLSAFFWPVNDPKTGTYVVISPWISPPVSSFNRNYTLNPTAGTPGNAWYEELEVGARTVVLGTPKTQNLALEGWSTTYWYQPNTHYQVATPLGALDATYREQPTEELRAYAIYTFDPAIDASMTFGVFQSLGGKQTVKVPGLAPLAPFGVSQLADSGLRTQETQLRAIYSMFLSPTLAMTAYGYFDVAAAGGTKERLLGVRFVKFF